MKTLLASLVFAGLLCGSAFAADLAETKSAFVDSISKTRATYNLTDKKKGIGREMALSPVEFLSLVAGNDRWSSAACQALDKDNAAKKLLARLNGFRADVAKIDTADAKTFLARTLDPALAALDAVRLNPAGRTQAHVDAVARLVAALK